MKREKDIQRNGLPEIPNFFDRITHAHHSINCSTPRPLRSSEVASNLVQSDSHNELHNDGILPMRHSCTADFSNQRSATYDTKFFERNDDTFEGLSSNRAVPNILYRRANTRCQDDYGIDYSCYQADERSSPPQFPDDTRMNLDWTETAESIIPDTFRRRSLVLDPAAFDSTATLDLLPQIPSSTRALRLRRSADTLRELGKRFIPRLRLGKRSSRSDSSSAGGVTTSAEEYAPSQPPSTTASHTSSRTRSNTIESTRSSRSMRSKRSSGQLALPTSWTHEQKYVPMHNMPPKAHSNMPGDSGSLQLEVDTEQYVSTISQHIAMQTCCDIPTSIAGQLPPLLETGRLTAPVIGLSTPDSIPACDVTDPFLEEILRQMQDDDEAFRQTELNMRTSGWSTEQDIEQVRIRRQETKNLWQRQLENALDSLKATTLSE